MLQRVSRLVLPPLLVIAALAVYRISLAIAGGSRPDQRITAPSLAPRRIAPTRNEPAVVTDEQLWQVLDRVKPTRDPVNTNNFVHALRLWGASADFGDPRIPTGRQMRDYLLDDGVFQQFAGSQAPPLFTRGPAGVEARPYEISGAHRATSSYHLDDLLATLAETGVPLDTPMQLRDGQAQVSELLDDSLRRFYLQRQEFEWSMICYIRYLFPTPEWRNKYGEKINLAGIVDDLVNHPLEKGPCDGLHRLEAAVLLLRADEQTPALPPQLRKYLKAYLKRTSDLLVQAQARDGYWSIGWSRGVSPEQIAKSATESAGPADQPAATVDRKLSPAPKLHDKLLVTGHHLEWLALAPDDLQPPREAVVRAGQWLARTLLEMDGKQLHEAYGPYSHAARALCLWRSREPFEFWRAGRPTPDQTNASN